MDRVLRETREYGRKEAPSGNAGLPLRVLPF